MSASYSKAVAPFAGAWIETSKGQAPLGVNLVPTRFGLRVLPQALSAIGETGLRSFLAQRVIERSSAPDCAWRFETPKSALLARPEIREFV
ncbi:MAG: hypothetical protein KGM15_01645 [Pseudomonadota bacterium]|nr:hypothetical protein [Pseudomonadota bacterium]